MKLIMKLCLFCIDIVYPNRCPCCNCFIEWNRYICDECEAEVKVDADVFCRSCGKVKQECICAVLPAYDRAAVVSFYEGKSKTALISMKESSNRNFGRYAGENLGKWIEQQPDWMEADGIVAVPMHWTKKLLRGYNQADVIAKSISSVTGIPVEKKCIIKRYSRKAQHKLGAKERAENVYSFISGGRDLEGRKLILCDDIITTGSTMSRCAEILKECGADVVYAAAAATTRRKREG